MILMQGKGVSKGVVKGKLYFYENGELATCGLIEYNGTYYYVYWGGIIKTGKQYVTRTRCDLPASMSYEFDETGKIIDGFVVKDGVKYYYENGIPATRGLTLIDGDYYYVYWNGEIKTGKQYTIATNCDLPVGTYEFDAEGRMYNGFYNGSNGAAGNGTFRYSSCYRNNSRCRGWCWFFRGRQSDYP